MELRIVNMYILLVMGILSVFLLGHATFFWFRIWKERHSSSAHAMTISLILVLGLSVIGLIHTITDALQKGLDEVNISLLMSSFTFIYSIVQVLFTRGYFLKGEME